MSYMSAGDIYNMIHNSVDIGIEQQQAKSQAYATGIANQIARLQDSPDYNPNAKVNLWDKLVNSGMIDTETKNIKANEINNKIRALESLIYGQQFAADTQSDNIYLSQQEKDNMANGTYNYGNAIDLLKKYISQAESGDTQKKSLYMQYVGEPFQETLYKYLNL